jgi:hypothetical protein
MTDIIAELKNLTRPRIARNVDFFDGRKKEICNRAALEIYDLRMKLAKMEAEKSKA